MNRGLQKGDALHDRTTGVEYYVVDSTLVDGCIQLLDRSSRQTAYRPLQNVYEGISSQTIKLHRKDEPKVPLLAHEGPAFLEHLRWTTKCLRKVLDTVTQLGMSFEKAFHLVRAEHNDQPFPSRAAMYRFRSRHQQGLLPLKGDKNKGCRKARYRPEVYELIKQHASLYCSPQSRWRMPAFVRFINQQAKDEDYISPEQNISVRHIREALKREGFIDTDAYRMERKNVAAARSIGATRIRTSFPLERVEMDSVHLPFHVQTEHGISSNVWCVHGIDAKTGMVLGWKLVIGNPCEDDGLDCIQSIVFSKKKALERLGLSYDIDVYGTPNLIVFDNGAEAKGLRMEKLVQIGIDTEHCPARHPHKKPYIERLNLSLKVALETLPGCTRFNGVDGRRNPVKEGDKLPRLHELEQMVVRWYYEHWGTQPLERHIHSEPEFGVTPLERWRYFTETSGHVMPLPIPLDDWRKVTLIKSERTLSSKTGITIDSLNYKGNNLHRLLQRFHEAKVPVYADPRDYRFIYVDDGTELVPLFEEFVQPDSPAYTVEHYKEQRKNLRVQHARKEATSFERDVWDMSMEMKARKPAKKSTENNRDTAAKHKASQAVRRAISKPLSSSELAGEMTNTVHGVVANFEDLPTLNILDRRTGGSKA